MSDRKLLEDAAKAAGIEVSPSDIRYWTWNPLTDDGDALRLAVKLGIDLQLWTLVRDDRSNDKFARAAVTRLCRSFSESESSDPDAATRRAIVRAAAALTQPEGGA